MFSQRLQHYFRNTISAFFRGSKKLNSKTFTFSFTNGFKSHSQMAINPINYLFPLIVIGGLNHPRNSQCFFNRSQLKQNMIEKRVQIIQYPANNPIEDRYKASQLTAINGYAISVFDGHGGWQLSEFASKRLHDEINYFLKENEGKFENEEDYIQQSIKQAYEKLESDFYTSAKFAYELGLASVSRIGSCALTAIIHNGVLYSANLGDCKGIIINIDPITGNKLNQINIVEGAASYRKINHMLNANSKKEQKRLHEQFPGEDDIFVCRKPKSCYVKNRLQPTRALGDLRMKYQEFNNPNNEPEEKGFTKQIPNFRGPYINAVPDQKVIPLIKGDRYLVMGSDGLWDELTKKNVADIVHKNKDSQERLIKTIFEESLSHAAKDNKISEEEIRKIPVGKRRKLHDDLTIIVVDLENQLK